MYKLNPGYKGLTIFLLSFILSFEYNYYINFTVFIICIILMLVNHVKIKRILFTIAPCFLMAIGVFFTGYMYNKYNINSDITGMNKDVVIIANIKNGLQLSARIMSYASLGLLFANTTDARRFILSLMQQFKLPRTFAYGILAAYGFIPIIASEYKNMKCAYMARGIKKNIFMLPLLVTAVRSSERLSMAMESKGFSAKSIRSQYLEIKVGGIDYFILIFSVIATSIFVIIF